MGNKPGEERDAERREPQQYYFCGMCFHLSTEAAESCVMRKMLINSIHVPLPAEARAALRETRAYVRSVAHEIFALCRVGDDGEITCDLSKVEAILREFRRSAESGGAREQAGAPDDGSCEFCGSQPTRPKDICQGCYEKFSSPSPGEAGVTTEWTPEVEEYRKLLMEKYSDRCSMEQIASAAYILGGGGQQ